MAIQLKSHSPKDLLALIDSMELYAQTFGTPAAEGLRDFFVGGEVSPDYLSKLQTASSTDPWTHGFAVVHEKDGLVIGCCGFKGPPVEGAVEIGYAIVPEYEGRGHATEAAKALMDYAVNTGQVRSIVAHTLPKKNASTRVLTKCGFQHMGEVHDPQDGAVWRWEKVVRGC